MNFSNIGSFEQEKEPFYFNIGQDLEEEENNNLINSSFYSLDNKERKDDTILDSNLHQDYGFNIKPDLVPVCHILKSITYVHKKLPATKYDNLSLVSIIL